MIEIKYRGHLSKKQLLQLQEYLNKNGHLIYSGYEKVIYFDTSIFPQIGDFVTGYSRVSLKSDQLGTVLRIKEGNPSEPVRNKIEVSIKKSHCRNLM